MHCLSINVSAGVSMTRVEESSDAAAGVSEFAFVHSGEYR